LRDCTELSVLVGLHQLCRRNALDLEARLGGEQPALRTLASALHAMTEYLEDDQNPDRWLALLDSKASLERLRRSPRPESVAAVPATLPASAGAAMAASAAIEEERKPVESARTILDRLQEIAARLVLVEPQEHDRFAQVSHLLHGVQVEARPYPGLSEILGEAETHASRLADAACPDHPGTYELLARVLEQAACCAGELVIAEQGGLGGELPSGSASLGAEQQLAAAETEASASGTADMDVEAPLPPDSDLELLMEFVTECRDLIEKAEASLLALETDPTRQEDINTVFRAFHTIKGTSGFLGIKLITGLAHRAENLLSRIRDGEIRCSGGYADLALRSIDGLKYLIESVPGAVAGGTVRAPEGYAELLDLLDHPQASGGEVTGRPAISAAPVQAAPAPSGASPTPAAAPASWPVLGPARRGTADADASVRIRTERLDRLIDMVGELVIAQSMVAQDDLVLRGHRPDLARKVTHASKIVRELQDLSMSMRMVPLRPTFQKMARLVRDLAQRGGKQIEFTTSGDDTEIDRNMVDVLGDPLVHMIRNAVDHGIEPPPDRVREGKNAAGTVSLAAFHAGGNVVVELLDDGRGLNREKIIRKAIERGLIESDKGMSDSDVYNLIFEAGFSTTDQVTEISGRGVGMDVVRRSIQALRGKVEISSKVGAGTRFTIKLPLTLAITDGMLVQVGGQRFILPTLSIHISFRPDASMLSTVTGRGEMVMLRGRLVPIVRLHRLFGISEAVEDLTRALLVVIEDGDRHAAVVIDELLGQQQVVAKSLGEGIGSIPGISGGAILGDGKVGLILDASGLTALARGGADLEEPLATVGALAA